MASVLEGETPLQVIQTENLTEDKPYGCSQCGKGFPKLRSLQRHVRQACQTSADPRNSAVFDFPGVIFVIRPDPIRK